MIRKPRILVVGIFVMDLIASTKQAPNRGETVIGLNFRTAPGGKGANQAVQCARLGANVTMVGRVGNDAYGRETVAAAAASGVDVSRVVVDAENPTGVSAITLEITETGAHNRIVVCPGANGAMTVEEISWIRDEVKNYDLVMLQFELPMFINEAVARWAHEAGVPVMVNPAPAAPVSPELFRCATFFSPNEHEAAAMAGHPIRVDDAGANEDDLRAVADIFREKGVENLIVTLGGNGSVAVNKDGVARVQSVKMPVVADTTAAGRAAFCRQSRAARSCNCFSAASQLHCPSRLSVVSSSKPAASGPSLSFLPPTAACAAMTGGVWNNRVSPRRSVIKFSPFFYKKCPGTCYTGAVTLQYPAGLFRIIKQRPPAARAPHRTPPPPACRTR